MKKILLATVAVAALGATAPALAADLAAAPRTYTKAPAYVQPIYNWTASTSAVTSAARSRATTACRATAASWAASRAALTISSPTTG